MTELVRKTVDINKEDYEYLKQNSIKLSSLVRDLVSDFINNKVTDVDRHPDVVQEDIDTFGFVKRYVRTVMNIEFYQYKSNDCDLNYAQWNRLHIALKENHIFIDDEIIRVMLNDDKMWN